jgi:predicted PurR-regulated permease PerM
MTTVGGEREAGESGSGIVPIWLSHLAGLSWRLVVVAALGLALFLLAAQLFIATASVVLAAIVAATFAPWVLALRRRGWSRTRAAAVVTFGAVIVITAVLLLITLAMVPDVSAMATSLAAGVDALRQFLAQLNLPPEIADRLKDAEQALQGWLSANVEQIAGTLATIVTIGILGTFETFFFMQDGDRAWLWGLQAIGEDRRDLIMASGDDALERVGGYLRGTTVIAAINGITDFIFLVPLGVPLAAPLAVFAFIASFIPIVGGIVATGVILLVAWAQPGLHAVLILLVLITIRNIILGNFVIPVVYGRTVKIHPALVLIALPAGAAVAGAVGLFVAIPLVAFVLSIAGALAAVLDIEPGRRPRATYYIPGWLDRLAQWSWRILAALLVGAVAVFLSVTFSTVVVSVVLAVILAATLIPFQRFLLRRGWGTGAAAAVVVLGAVVIITLIIVLTTVSLLVQGSQIVADGTTGAGSSDGALGGQLGGLVAVVQQFGGALVDILGSVVSGIASLAVVLVLAILLTFFFLRDGAGWWAKGMTRLSTWRRTQVDEAGSRSVGVLGGYMVGTGAISAVGALSQFLIMAILGIPLALPLAVLSFFGGYIPYIGSILTTGLAFLVTVAVGTPTDVIVMGLFTVAFNIVQGNIVAPLVYGRAVNIHPGVILIAIPAASAVAGIMGMFLVVPVLGVIAASWRTVLFVFGDEPAATASISAASSPTAPEASPSGASDRPPDLGPAPAT